MSSPACRPIPRVSDLQFRQFQHVATYATYDHAVMLVALSAGQGDLVVPRTRTVGFGPQSFSVAGRSLWNTLPSDMKQLSLLKLNLSTKTQGNRCKLDTHRQHMI